MSDLDPMTNADNSGSSLRERWPLILAIAATALGLIIVIIAAFLLLRDSDTPILGGGETPTPFAQAGGVPRSPLIVVNVSDSPQISLTLDVPVQLEVGGEEFAVETRVVDTTGKWTPDFPSEDTALWAFGTVVNYVLGLENTGSNRRALEVLVPGDEVRLTLQDGSVMVFVVTSREIVPTSQTDIFRQQTPSITLAMLAEEGTDRLVVRGDYKVTEGATEGASGAAGNVVAMGETAQLGDYRFTVNGTTSLVDRPEAPPGFMFFLVNYQVQNAGPGPLNTNNLRLELRDEFGNQYALNPVASRLGSAPPLEGTLNAGEVREATAGYQLPLGLVSPTLIWSISRSDDPNGQAVRVTIPYAAGSGAGTNALVVPQSAEVSLDGTSVTVVGQLTNTGEQPLIVEEGAVTLTSEGTLFLKLSTNPSFPWVVPPGQTITFSVAFQRPLTSEAVFTVLGQPFLLTGLR